MKSKVTVSFENEGDTEEFRRTLCMVKDKGASPLYNALLISALTKAQDITAETPEWSAVHDGIDQDATQRGLCDMDVFTIWKSGLQAWIGMKKLGAHFPHES